MERPLPSNNPVGGGFIALIAFAFIAIILFGMAAARMAVNVDSQPVSIGTKEVTSPAGSPNTVTVPLNPKTVPESVPTPNSQIPPQISP